MNLGMVLFMSITFHEAAVNGMETLLCVPHLL